MSLLPINHLCTTPHQLPLPVKILVFRTTSPLLLLITTYKKSVVATFINEEKEKAKRRLNLMIHNVPESSSEDGLTRENHDVDFVTKMCQTQFSIKVVINKAFRLGKKDAKPRLLKISLSSDTEKTTILKNSMKLRSSDASPVYKSIFITPDLTPKEQECYKQLRAELRERNRGGQTFQIKNGKIVRRKQ